MLNSATVETVEDLKKVPEITVTEDTDNMYSPSVVA